MLNRPVILTGLFAVQLFLFATECLSEEFDDLKQVASAHSAGIMKVMEQNFTLRSDQGAVSRFMGRGNSCLVEHEVEGDVFVTCADADRFYRLWQKVGNSSFVLTDLRYQALGPVQAARALANHDANCFSAFYYFEIPIADFLSRKDLSISEVTRSLNPETREEEVSISWALDSEDYGKWIGRFVLVPGRFWAARIIERTKNPNAGVFQVENEFSNEDSDSPLATSITTKIKPVGKEEVVKEVISVELNSDDKVPASRFLLSYYGLPDDTGRPVDSGVRLWTLGVAVAFGLVILALVMAKRHNQ